MRTGSGRLYLIKVAKNSKVEVYSGQSEHFPNGLKLDAVNQVGSAVIAWVTLNIIDETDFSGIKYDRSKNSCL